ncbi:MAG: DUF4179 domain-containing protein [Cellulosilyticaceae bacterium]
MEKNIYDLINEIDIDLEEYEVIKLSKLEEKRMMKKFSEVVKAHKVGNKNSRKYIGIAAAALVAVGSVSAIPTFASTNETMYKIATFLGIEKNLSDYETVVGQEVTKDGVTMRLNEVILNNSHLLVSVTTYLEEGRESDFTGPGGSVYINGKAANKGSSWTSTILEDGTGLSVMRLPLGEAPQGDVAIKLSLNTPYTNVDKSPHWNFEFKANGEALRQDTQTVAIEQYYDLEGEAEVTIHAYEGNTVEHRITYSGVRGEYSFMELIGTDEKGNEVIFAPGPVFDGTGEFIAELKYNQILDEAKTLTLALYDRGERLSENFEVNK